MVVVVLKVTTCLSIFALSPRTCPNVFIWKVKLFKTYSSIFYRAKILNIKFPAECHKESREVAPNVQLFKYTHNYKMFGWPTRRKNDFEGGKRNGPVISWWE